MAKDPAFLFYSNDFLSGTQFLTDEQVGKYIRLLIAQHQSGHLDEKHMIFICKTYDKDIFQKFIRDADGKYFNERLENEIVKRKEYAESRAKNRTSKKNISVSYVPHMENANRDINKDSIVFKEKEDFSIIKETESNQAFEFMFRLGRKEITNTDILNFWEIFKIHKPEYSKESRQRQMQHFRDWLKFQKKQDGTSETKLGTSAARVAALKALK